MTQERPEKLPSRTIRTHCRCGTIYLTISYLNGRPFEIFIIAGRNGECRYTMSAAIGILMSKRLQEGASLEKIAADIAGISCLNRSNGVESKGAPVLSCVDAVSRLLTGATTSDRVSTPPDPIPPGCDKRRIFGLEGCWLCHRQKCAERIGPFPDPDTPRPTEDTQPVAPT